MPRPRPTYWPVFISSTVKDLEDERRQIAEVLRARDEEVVVSLSEDWTPGWVDIAEKCRNKILDSRGFILVLGFYYGSIPPQRDKSITHMEFEWAVSKWDRLPTPPMAVMRPKRNSKAAIKLRGAADDLLKQLSDDERLLHDNRLAAFHRAATDPQEKWRGVTEFPDTQYLRESVLSIYKDWKYGDFAEVLKGQGDNSDSAASHPKVTDSELGLLGRDEHIHHAKNILAEFESRMGEPCMCFVVSGNEDAEHKLFLLNLAQTGAFARSPSALERPPIDFYDLSVLSQWIASSLGLRSKTVASPGELAEEVARELLKRPLRLWLNQIHRFTGGVAGFQFRFWRPFRDRLKELVLGKQSGNRFLGVVLEYTGVRSNWAQAVVNSDKMSDVDFDKLVLLPVLSPFTPFDVFRWLQNLQVPNDYDFHRQLAGRVLTDVNGSFDGTPSRVVVRLRSEVLWPQKENI